MRTDPKYRSAVRTKYNEVGDIWSADDPWHGWTHRQIQDEMSLVESEFGRISSKSEIIIDVGSAGRSYFSTTTETVHIDIAEGKLRGCDLAVCGSAETIPFANEITNLVICVGPVINYCSIEEVVEEFSRICKPNATLVLHVELSNSFEFVGRPEWRADAAFVRTFYKGEERYWVYSDSLCRRILIQSRFEIRRVRYFHFASSFVYRITKRPNLSSRLAFFDRIFSRLPGCGSFADSAIYVCQAVR